MPPADDARSEVLLVGGRSGVGKTTAAAALHRLLVERDVVHAIIEGDALDLAHPTPYLTFPTARLAERNLAFMWSNYRELGYRRLVYTNTSSVVVADDLVAAMGDDPRVIAVLLRAGDETTERRLAHRDGGTADADELAHSTRTARRLDDAVTADVHRIDTDRASPVEVAERLLELTSWAAS